MQNNLRIADSITISLVCLSFFSNCTFKALQSLVFLVVVVRLHDRVFSNSLLLYRLVKVAGSFFHQRIASQQVRVD